MHTLAAAVASGAARLRAAGFTREDADRDAGVLARGLLGWSLADWMSRRDDVASPDWLNTFEALIGRREAREPVAYLLGTREFYGRPFAVTSSVLIPRPETELLVDLALEWCRAAGARSALDVGTGSGCIAVTLALESPALVVTGLDCSADALATARQNALALGGADRLVWRLSDLLTAVTGSVDLIVSNPPYVPERDRAGLSRDVRDFEPGLALFGGPDGLDVIRRLIPAAAACLRPGGALIMEVGAGQSDAVTSLLADAGFSAVTWHADLQAIPRVVIAHLGS